MVKAFRDTWELGIHSYLNYLRERLIVSRDLLTETGSCFVQIGDENAHLVRSIMDEVFGSENFVSSIVFRTSSGLGSSRLRQITDNIYWYSKDRSRFKFRRQFLESDSRNFTHFETDDGQLLTYGEYLKSKDKISGRPLESSDLVSSGRTESCVYPYEYLGTTFDPGRARSWKTNQTGMKNLDIAGRLISAGRTLRYKAYSIIA